MYEHEDEGIDQAPRREREREREREEFNVFYKKYNGFLR